MGKVNIQLKWAATNSLSICLKMAANIFSMLQFIYYICIINVYVLYNLESKNIFLIVFAHHSNFFKIILYS